MARLNFQPVAVDRIARVEPLVAGQAAHRPHPKQVHQPVEALAVQRIARPALAPGAQKRGSEQIRLLALRLSCRFWLVGRPRLGWWATLAAKALLECRRFGRGVSGRETCRNIP